MLNRLSIFMLGMFTALSCWGQAVQVSTSAPRAVETGEQFEITFTVNAQPSGFRPPEFKGFTLLGGPSTSTSSSVQIINGRMTQSMAISYSYYLQGNTAGTYTIEGAKATVDGKTYQSNPVNIEVVKGQAAASHAGRGNQQQSQSSSDVVAETGNDDIFVKVIVDKTSLYQGEHLTATIKLFSKLNISAIENAEFPPFNGFYRQDIETQPLRQLDRENINGQIYLTGVIQKMVLSPQKSGNLTIDPFVLQCVVQQAVKSRSRSVFDDFFGPSVQEFRKKIKSRPVVINVKPLPAGAPASFNGAVGKFTFNASLDKNRVKSNDAISLKVSIGGVGNMKMIEPFDIKFPTDFETYDPKVNVTTTASSAGISGNKTFDYLIIPRHSGQFKIPGITFTWFDTQSKQYKTVTSPDFDVTVDKGADESSNAVVTGVSKEDVKYIGKDIQYIKTRVPDFRTKDKFLFGSFLFIFIYLLSVALFVAYIIILRKKIKENSNISLVRNKKANKVAQKRLKQAHESLKQSNKETFYDNTIKALWGYMSDKLNIPQSELSRDNVVEESGKRGIDQQLISKFLELVDICEYARYAPAESASQMDVVYSDAVLLISKLEQKVR